MNCCFYGIGCQSETEICLNGGCYCCFQNSASVSSWPKSQLKYLRFDLCTSYKLFAYWKSIEIKLNVIQVNITAKHCSRICTLKRFNHTFRLSQLHQCDQGILPNRLSWKFNQELLFYIVTLASVLFFSRRPSYLTAFLAFLPWPWKELFRGKRIRSTNLTINADL